MMVERLPLDEIRLHKWSSEADDRLCELVSEDIYSFSEIGVIMGRSKCSVLGRFQRIAARMEGWVR